MSTLFSGPGGFEDRLELAFRGSAKEQKEATKKFSRLKSLRSPFRDPGRRLGSFDLQLLKDNPLSPKSTLGSSNIFKSNLGGTSGRLT